MRRPQATPVFFGCEGLQESTFVSWIALRARNRGIPLAIRNEPLGKAGSPRVKVELAASRMAKREEAGVPFVHRFALIDLDVIKYDLAEIAAVEAIAARAGLVIIWQDPCHQAVLLRAMGFNGRIQDTNHANQLMDIHWPGYEKGLAARHLDARLGPDNEPFRRLAGVARFGAMLGAIGLAP